MRIKRRRNFCTRKLGMKNCADTSVHTMSVSQTEQACVSYGISYIQPQAYIQERKYKSNLNVDIYSDIVHNRNVEIENVETTCGSLSEKCLPISQFEVFKQLLFPWWPHLGRW